MKKINFTNQEINQIKDIIERYRNVSDELSDYQKKAEEIQSNVIRLTARMDNIKKEEDNVMTELHRKYGKFSLQDVYNIINNVQ